MKVSVLIPAYNVEKYIYQCLESVCGQTHHDLQIVVIDDGSNDSTFSIISNFAKKDTRIEAISQENRGVAQTRNELIERAVGDFVLFVDSDDWIEPEMISTLITLSKKNNVDLVMCRLTKDNSVADNKIANFKIWPKDIILDKFIEHRELTGSLCNKLIQRKLFEGIRFNPKIGYGEDAMIIWDIINKIDNMISTSHAFYHYRMNDSSISHQGLTESKMSVIPVWEYICESKYAKRNNLTSKTKSRYGAEITLLLLGTIGSEKSKVQNNRIRILLNKLKGLYPHMLYSKTLSYKFKIFASMALLNWKLLDRIAKHIKK